MEFRKPTFEEIFNISHSIELSKQQSSYFINQSLAKGGISAGLADLPHNISMSAKAGDITKSKIAISHTKNYISDNWRPLLVAAVAGGIIIFVATQLYQKDKKDKYNQILS